MFIPFATLAVMILITFMMGMITAFMMMMNALARMKK